MLEKQKLKNKIIMGTNLIVLVPTSYLTGSILLM